LFIIGHMGLFFYNKIGSIISIVDLPTTNIIEPKRYYQVAIPFMRLFCPALVSIDYSSRIQLGKKLLNIWRVLLG
ncbi:hypothetical protein, partial [Streptococcus pneumoniae]